MANFVRHISCSKCGSSDANALYDDNSTYCFSCTAVVRSSSDSVAIEKTRTKLTIGEVQNMTEKNILDKDEYEELKKITTTKPGGFRGIRDEIYSKFGVRHAINENNEVITQYYPVTKDGELVGLKKRDIPKIFSSIGYNSSDCELFMQFRFDRSGKYLLITEGEIDSLSAYQIMNDYNKSKGNGFEIAVVSPTVGAACSKQIRNNYKFFDKFDQIIISFDNDNAGKEGVDKIIKHLPKGKVRIMNNRYKDANEYLLAGKESEFIRDFYNAEIYVPVGVLGSGKLYDKIIEQAYTQKLLFPPFMNKLNDKTNGIPLGHIINIAAKTGIGKTVFVNEMIYHWILTSPHKIGVVSMELDAAQYGEVLLSRHISKKIALIKDEDERQSTLRSEAIKNKANELFLDENGNDSFYLLDNRDGSVEEIQDTIEELIISCGCKIIVLDPLQDLLAGLSIEQQEMFMKWARGSIKSHGVTFIFINHMRKTQGAPHHADEEDFQGSSTIIKSASINIILSRDKNADDDIDRNTTRISVHKNRITGLTGPAGEVYYDNDTHTLHDKDVFFGNH